jgi:hypothetical protein
MVIIKQFAGNGSSLNRFGNVHVQRTHLSCGKGAEGGLELGILAVVEDSHGSLLGLFWQRGSPRVLYLISSKKGSLFLPLLVIRQKDQNSFLFSENNPQKPAFFITKTSVSSLIFSFLPVNGPLYTHGHMTI